MSSNAGGAATNAGIDFQQRISALFLTHMLMDVIFIDDLGLDKNSKIIDLKCESSHEIDDLVVSTDLANVYIQAKRSINCSDSGTSEFYKVIKQFVSQYLSGVNKNDRFVLATSSKASSKITKDLKKVLESIKLNDTGFIQNPLNQSEKKSFDSLKLAIKINYEALSGKKITEDVISKILSQTHISVIDIEEGMPLEKAILTLISGKAIIAPELLWSNLISIGLTLSKNRSSINVEGLEEKVGRFVSKPLKEKKSEIEHDFFKVEIKRNLCSGREVLIVEKFSEDTDFTIVEFIRFEEDGTKRLAFYDNKVELLNGETRNVIYRAATFSGVERYITENKEIFLDARVSIIEINSEENYDKMSVSQSHSDLCLRLINENDEPLICIHCGEHISDDSAPLIEVDEKNIPHQIGSVHNNCLTVIDRVLGIIDSELFRENENLTNFDYESWYYAIYKGQGLFSGVSNLPKGAHPVLWKPDYSDISKGKYCVKINLEDGSSRYVQDRGRVVRETKDSGGEKCNYFDEIFIDSRNDKDPHCYTSKSGIFTQYSQALKYKSDDDILICENTELTLFSRAIDKTYSVFENYYAPLIIFMDQESGMPMLIEGAMILLSDPLKLDFFINNWKKADIEISSFTTSIIKSDEAFDKLVMNFKSDGIKVIINPELDMKGQLVSGLIIEDFNDMENVMEKYN
jgi:hypothetical protein